MEHLELRSVHDHVIVRAVKSLGESPSLTSLPVHSESEGGSTYRHAIFALVSEHRLADERATCALHEESLRQMCSRFKVTDLV